jgi:hypothetical protein
MGGGLEYECQRKTGAVLVVNGIERLDNPEPRQDRSGLVVNLVWIYQDMVGFTYSLRK